MSIGSTDPRFTDRSEGTNGPPNAPSEIDIGTLFVRAEKYVDGAMRKAESEASTIIAEARALAEDIVNRARLEAKGIVDGVEERSGVPDASISDFEKAIERLTGANAQLCSELAQLNATLVSRSNGTPSSETGPGLWTSPHAMRAATPN